MPWTRPPARPARPSHRKVRADASSLHHPFYGSTPAGIPVCFYTNSLPQLRVLTLPAIPPAPQLRPETTRSASVTGSPREKRRMLPSQRSEEHTSELQSLMRISYAVFCLKKKKITQHNNTTS